VTPRGTDWSLALLVALGLGTGLATWFAGSPHSAWVFAAHAAGGAALALVLVWKLRRVWTRIVKNAFAVPLAQGDDAVNGKRPAAETARGFVLMRGGVPIVGDGNIGASRCGQRRRCERAGGTGDELTPADQCRRSALIGRLNVHAASH